MPIKPYIKKIILRLATDRHSRVARLWSNEELRKFAHLFKGSVVNVSAWKDEDKEGNKYRDYFVNASEYWITNYMSEARGFQGLDNEIFLDLTQDLPPNLKERFDVVFNHTTLEHIFEVFKAFENLCLMSKDIVIVVVPFLQPQHAEYGDYWRFTPLTLKELFKKYGMEMIYINFNDNSYASIYLFAIGSKKPKKYDIIKNHPDNKLSIIDHYFVGEKIIKNTPLYSLRKVIHTLKSRIKRT